MGAYEGDVQTHHRNADRRRCIEETPVLNFAPSRRQFIVMPRRRK
jgi:hypothetical protein